MGVWLIAIDGEEEVGGDVNRLLVLNTSGKPLYLMPGEVISGGQPAEAAGVIEEDAAWSYGGGGFGGGVHTSVLAH